MTKIIEKILEGTEFEKDIKKLKVSGITNLTDISNIKRSGRMGEVLKQCIDNEDDIIKLDELFEKERKEWGKKFMRGLSIFVLIPILLLCISLIIALN